MHSVTPSQSLLDEIISHASLDLLSLFPWLCDVNDLGTLEIHWCPVAKLISAGSCLYCWVASVTSFRGTSLLSFCSSVSPQVLPIGYQQTLVVNSAYAYM